MADPTAQAFPLITAEALAELRKRIGVPARRPAPYIEVATRDAVRHWAAGIGDRNPYWLEAGVAPPTILFALDRIVSGYVGGLPGIHAMYGGTDFRWRRPIRIGDTVVGESVLLDLVEKPSTFARRAIQQIYRTTFRDQAGELVCEADSWCFRTERDTARERGKYGAAEPARYTAREIAAIAAAYRSEEIRGRMGTPSRCSSAIPPSGSRTRRASRSRRSACTGTRRWRAPSACRARTTTVPSASPGSGTWSPTGWAMPGSSAGST